MSSLDEEISERGVKGTNTTVQEHALERGDYNGDTERGMGGYI